MATATSAGRDGADRNSPTDVAGSPADDGTRGHVHHTSTPLRGPILWGLVLGALQAASPLAFRWLEPATVHALGLGLIASIYIGFAVADGRRRVIVTETLVASLFVIAAAMAVTNTAWILVVGYAGHGCKDFWQERRAFVSTTRWWPPFCAAVDWVVALVLIIEIVAGVHFHQ
jgi:hypothetical protein